MSVSKSDQIHMLNSVQSHHQVDHSKANERSGSHPATLHYNQEISKLSKMKSFDQAISTYERMIQNGVQPDVVTYNTMINVYVKYQKLSESFQLFETMKKENITPTIVTYTSLIDGCGKSGNFGRAYQLYQELKSSEIEPNMHFFNAILNAGLLTSNSSIINEVFTEISKRNLHPNTVTYNTLLAGFFRIDQLGRMREVVEQMIRENIEFSSITQTNILQASQLIRNQTDVKLFIDLLDAAHIIPTKVQASQAVLDLIILKRLLPAQQLYIALSSLSCSFNDEVVLALISLSGEFGNTSIMNWAINISYSHSISAPSVIYSAEIDSDTHLGNISTAMKRYKQRDPQFQIPLSVRVSLITALVTDDRIEDATLVASDALSANQFSQYSFSSPSQNQEQPNSASIVSPADLILSVFADYQFFQTVLWFFDELSSRNIEVHTIGANSVIISAISLGKIQTLTQIYSFKPSATTLQQMVSLLPPEIFNKMSWEEMVMTISSPPHPTIFNQLIDSFIAKNHPKGAWVAFKHCVQLGVETCENTLKHVFHCLKSFEETTLDEHLFLLNIYKESGFSPSEELYSNTIKQAIDVGSFADAQVIHDEAVSLGISIDSTIESNYNQIFIKLQKSLPMKQNFKISPRPMTSKHRSMTCPRMHMQPEYNFSGPWAFSSANDMVIDVSNLF